MSDDTEQKRFVGRLILSSDDFPAHLDDRARARAWTERLEALFGSFEPVYAEDQPFTALLEATQFGNVRLSKGAGSMTRQARSKQDIAKDGLGDFVLAVNLGGPTALCCQRNEKVELTHGTMTLASMGEPVDVTSNPGGAYWSITVSRDKLRELVKDPDDLLMRQIDPNTSAARLLRSYLKLLFDVDQLDNNPVLTAHVDRTLTDLVAIALGADRDSSEIALTRGTRAARLQLILSGIEANFDDAHFNTRTLASSIGLSPRYTQELLNETGRTFSERVLELRLQKALKMLSDTKFAGTKVSAIAYACGFNEVSYFNRCFRRRFGASPTQYRP
ncbi:MAG: helix-turn-helix transcriptional regulator [Pseudomonadota bacterium]